MIASNPKRILQFVLVFFSIFIFSCSNIEKKQSNNIADISAKVKIISVIGLDGSGRLHAFNAQTGKQLEDCSSRKKPCRATIKRDANGDPIFKKGRPVLVYENGKEAPVINHVKLLITNFKGSECTGFYANERQYSDCDHPQPLRPFFPSL